MTAHPEQTPPVASMRRGDPRKVSVLLLDSEDDGLALVIARCLQLAATYEVDVLTQDERSRLRRSRRVGWSVEDLSTPASMLDAVERWGGAHQVDVIVPVQEAMVVNAGFVGSQMAAVGTLAPIPDPETTARADHKWSFHQTMVRAGVPVPRTTTVSQDRRGLVEELESWGGDLLVKPSLGWGGQGIRRFASAKDLLATLPVGGSDSPDDIVIQEFLPGQDIDCSFLAREGEVVAHTIQRVLLTQGASYRSGLGLEFSDVDGVLEVAQQFARATHWSGVAHLDMRVDERTGELRLIEVNPRYWATLLGSLAVGVNFPDLHVRMALGQPLEAQPASEGTWVDYHALTRDPRNLVALARHPRALRSVRVGHLRGDPLVEAVVLYRNLRHLAARARRAVAAADQGGR